jgi:hypothetical protein
LSSLNKGMSCLPLPQYSQCWLSRREMPGGEKIASLLILVSLWTLTEDWGPKRRLYFEDTVFSQREENEDLTELDSRVLT